MSSTNQPGATWTHSEHAPPIPASTCRNLHPLCLGEPPNQAIVAQPLVLCITITASFTSLLSVIGLLYTERADPLWEFLE